MSRTFIIEVGVIVLALLVGYAGLSFADRTVLPAPTVIAQVTSTAPTATIAPAVTFTPAPSRVAATPVVATATSAAATSPTALRTPTVALTVTSTPPTVTYVVQPGDTMEGIAQKFGVTVDAIARVNQLSDPNKLALGQRLIIPPK
ncbi:MAG TPA: LysM domain-containing protein [Chloroflexota bacterium]|nr:LysM domain-containing protein [Chloroflexota bacterium]